MPTEQILALLMTERDKLNRAIEALQGPKKRQGRPPKNSLDEGVANAKPAPKTRKRRRFTTAQREAAAERMRQRWAVKKKADARGSKPRKKAAKAAA